MYLKCNDFHFTPTGSFTEIVVRIRPEKEFHELNQAARLLSSMTEDLGIKDSFHRFTSLTEEEVDELTSIIELQSCILLPCTWVGSHANKDAWDFMQKTFEFRYQVREERYQMKLRVARLTNELYEKAWSRHCEAYK